MPYERSDSPQVVARRLESSPLPPTCEGRRLGGYGVTGVTFASGHVLALRRVAASSNDPPRTSVWHREPHRGWTVYCDPGPEAGGAVCAPGMRAVRDDVTLSWPGTHSLLVRVLHARLAWAVHLVPTVGTRLLSAVASHAPAAAWRSPLARRVAVDLGARALGVGRATLDGRSPEGRLLAIRPHCLWSVDASTGRIHGRHLGPLVLARIQDRIGDFWIPRWGLFLVGEALAQAGHLRPESPTPPNARPPAGSWDGSAWRIR
jgi:hypothetical protein